MQNKEIIQKVHDILTPVMGELKLWDIELVKEGPGLYLRVYIDKEGGIGIEDCEYISRHLSEALDKIDPIRDPYMLEVSSPGINRALKRDSDFLQYIGHAVDIKLYKPINKTKQFRGVLDKYENEVITIKDNKTTYQFNKKDIAGCRLATGSP